MEESNVVEVLFTILDGIPENSLLYVGDYVYSAFEDKFLTGLMDFSVELGEYKTYFHFCFQLSDACRSYFKDELLKDNYLINYFCHYMIKTEQDILLKVHDYNIFIVHDSIRIPQDLIKRCKQNEGSILIKEKIEII